MPAETDTLFQAVVTEITATTPSKASKMFGMPCLKNQNGKAFAGFHQGAMSFKLHAPAHGTALALPGAHLFDPTASGRPMKEWVVVPAEFADQWLTFAHAALAYVTEGS